MNGASDRGFVLPLPGRLSVRLALLLTLALLPLGIVSIYQTMQLRGEIQGRTSEALLGETLRTAAPEIELIRMARGIVTALAVSDGVLGDPAACLSLMSRVAAQIPQATSVGFVRLDGTMDCSTADQSFDLSENPNFQRNVVAQTPEFSVDQNAVVSGLSFVSLSQPVFDDSGVYRGYVVLSLPQSSLSTLESPPQPGDRRDIPVAVFWTFDREGTVLTSSSGPEAVGQQLPRDLPLTDYIGSEARVFQAISAAGMPRTYAVVPLRKDELYLMSSWRPSDASPILRLGIAQYLPPLIMVAVGLIVAGWASERLVNRHMRVLHRSIARFSHGDRSISRIDMDGAPRELKEVGDAFVAMTDSITRSEAELEDSIHQKEVLLREVHHRVKNNLQLIASIMNMQMRRTHTPEVKQVLKGLQDRVMSLATIHRGLYQTSGLADIQADELLGDIVRQIITLGSGPGRTFDLDLDIDGIRMTPDQAVPLSLLLTEAMTNAMKYAGAPAGQTPCISVHLKRNGGDTALLTVRNRLPADMRAEDAQRAAERLNDGTGLGTQLLQAFAHQIGGTLTQEVSGDDHTIAVHFEVSKLNEAENRTVPPTPTTAGS